MNVYDSSYFNMEFNTFKNEEIDSPRSKELKIIRKKRLQRFGPLLKTEEFKNKDNLNGDLYFVGNNIISNEINHDHSTIQNNISLYNKLESTEKNIESNVHNVRDCNFKNNFTLLNSSSENGVSKINKNFQSSDSSICKLNKSNIESILGKERCERLFYNINVLSEINNKYDDDDNNTYNNKTNSSQDFRDISGYAQLDKSIEIQKNTQKENHVYEWLQNVNSYFTCAQDNLKKYNDFDINDEEKLIYESDEIKISNHINSNINDTCDIDFIETEDKLKKIDSKKSNSKLKPSCVRSSFSVEEIYEMAEVSNITYSEIKDQTPQIDIITRNSISSPKYSSQEPNVLKYSKSVIKNNLSNSSNSEKIKSTDESSLKFSCKPTTNDLYLGKDDENESEGNIFLANKRKPLVDASFWESYEFQYVDITPQKEDNLNIITDIDLNLNFLEPDTQQDKPDMKMIGESIDFTYVLPNQLKESLEFSKELKEELNINLEDSCDNFNLISKNNLNKSSDFIVDNSNKFVMEVNKNNYKKSLKPIISAKTILEIKPSVVNEVKLSKDLKSGNKLLDYRPMSSKLDINKDSNNKLKCRSAVTNRLKANSSEILNKEIHNLSRSENKLSTNNSISKKNNSSKKIKSAKIFLHEKIDNEVLFLNEFKSESIQNSNFNEDISDVNEILCLPDEILIKIFSFLAISDLSKCSIVCQHFKKIAYDYSLWKHKDFIIDSKSLRNEWLDLFAYRNPANVHLTKCTGQDLNSDTLRNFINNISHSLCDLNISGCSKDPLTGYNILLLSTGRCKTISSLDVSWTNVDYVALHEFAIPKPNCHVCPLVNLNLAGCQKLNENCILQVLKVHGTSLRKLDLSDLYFLTNDIAKIIQKYCPHLISLNLSNCRKICDILIGEMASSLQKLEILNLSGCKLINDHTIRSIASHCSRLTHLIVSSCHLITDISVSHISAHLPDIRYIDVCGCVKISNVGLKVLVRSCSKLEYLDLSSTQVNSRGLQALSSYAGHHLQVLKVNNCKQIDRDSLNKLITHSTRLKELWILGLKIPSTDLITQKNLVIHANLFF